MNAEVEATWPLASLPRRGMRWGSMLSRQPLSNFLRTLPFPPGIFLPVCVRLLIPIPILVISTPLSPLNKQLFQVEAIVSGRR